jgi:hypothetical protein
MGKPMLRPLDYAALALAVAAAAGSAAALSGGGEARFVVRADGGVWVFPLDARETLAARGPLGDTVIELRDGAARVLSSPCANQSCVAAGAARSPGAWLACLPNRVMVSVDTGAGPEPPPDGAARGVDVTAW